MDSVGGFHIEKIDGKRYLAYHHMKYHPVQCGTSSLEAASNEQLLFSCPNSRLENKRYFFPVHSSPEYVPQTTSTDKRFDPHQVLPFTQCDNKELYKDDLCSACYTNLGSDSYFCSCYLHRNYHKECVESPPQIKHPYHPQHSLQLYKFVGLDIDCFCCGTTTTNLAYRCTICLVSMHPTCAMKSISFDIDQAKTHNHPLTFFPRQSFLTCNVCGLLKEDSPTYICVRCNFVAHKDCMYFPRVIRISRHHHRLSHTSSLPSGEWSCGVCRQSINTFYGAYTCDTCGDYAVHSRCALRKEVCDGNDLEGLPEEDDITQDPQPFEIISDGQIHHFLHDHHLHLELNTDYDENKLCQACAVPVYEGNFYSCKECNFILHEACANAPRRKQHPAHPHPLTLKVVTFEYNDKGDGGEGNNSGFFICDTCGQGCGGFIYECRIGKCCFKLDIRCALITEPFGYQGHEHPLFLALALGEQKTICRVCKLKSTKPLNCIKCDFIVCFRCVTLPYKARYKHDKHLLTVLYGEEVSKGYWCEMCERKLGDTNVFYSCNDCSTTLHIECLLGHHRGMYLKNGQTIKYSGKEAHLIPRNSVVRPFCYVCKNRCEGQMYKLDEGVICSAQCFSDFCFYGM